MKKYDKLLKKRYKKSKKMPLANAIDVVFSHNQRVAIWEYDEKRMSTRVWIGMAWELPIQYHNVVSWKIFGAVPESIVDADLINISILRRD